jgi:hypothetical protein
MDSKQILREALSTIRSKKRKALQADIKIIRKATGIKVGGKKRGNHSGSIKRSKGTTPATNVSLEETGRSPGAAGEGG